MTDASTTTTAEAAATIGQLAAALGGEVQPAAQSPGYGPQIRFGPHERSWRSGVTPLLEYGLLKVHGADAAGFLQAQLTSDVAGLGADEVGLAGYCSVKGRLTASFWIWRDEPQQAFWLACSRDIAAPIARRLSMFVLRAKVKIEDVSETTALLGMISLPDDPLPGLAVARVPLPPVDLAAPLVQALAPIDGDAAQGRGQALRVLRAMQPVAAADLQQALEQWRAAGARLLPTYAWRRLEVLSGVARINAGNQELFVPQMVNFELVAGVNFRKGCYPGQEIVARSQYLGKLKRRMFLGLGKGAVPPPGADVSVDAGMGAGTGTGGPAGEPRLPAAAAAGRLAEPVGQVVLAAPLPDGGRFVVLFESRIAAVPGDGPAPVATGLQVGGSALSRLPLPYALPANDKPDAR